MWFMVDIEATGPSPSPWSMVQLGAVQILDNWTIGETYYGELRPLPEDPLDHEAVTAMKYDLDKLAAYPNPTETMKGFGDWVKGMSHGERSMFISDNNGFDWMFTCWYFHMFTKDCPFGFSSTNLGSLYKGLEKDMFKNFKHLRKTEHTHNPVDDATGNAEAFIYMKKEMGLKA